MQRFSTRPMVAMASVAALLLGGCATAAFERPVSGTDGSTYGVSPSTSPSGSPGTSNPTPFAREGYPEFEIQAP